MHPVQQELIQLKTNFLNNNDLTGFDKVVSRIKGLCQSRLIPNKDKLYSDIKDFAVTIEYSSLGDKGKYLTCFE